PALYRALAPRSRPRAVGNRAASPQAFVSPLRAGRATGSGLASGGDIFVQVKSGEAPFPFTCCKYPQGVWGQNAPISRQQPQEPPPAATKGTRRQPHDLTAGGGSPIRVPDLPEGR